jgi:deferrochelatase/peroxidase EfeB
MRQGALLLLTIVDADAARAFLDTLKSNGIHFQEGAGAEPAAGFFRTVALTADGLRRLGVDRDVLDWFPKEYREGMEARSGLVGDVRENHPRRWILPARNWPPLAADADPFARARPPIETSEIDIVLQIRTASEDRAALMAEIARLAELAGPGVPLQGYELMCAKYDETGLLVDYFGFHDGVSQPKAEAGLPESHAPGPRGDTYNNDARLGEVLLGYRNDRDDFAPVDFKYDEPWQVKQRRTALDYQRNGTFLVLRKLEQKTEAFETLIRDETVRINRHHPASPLPMTEDRLKARMLGRHPDGRPLLDSVDGTRNNFNFRGDVDGAKCPLAAHIRRTNPRDSFQGRGAPRIIRRGMSFDHSDGIAGAGARGLMFMAYNASIAEQFETIQRWINGGNSTSIASGHNDPILGVAPKTGALHKASRVFRFVEDDEVIRVTMPEPFVALHWGLYLFVPSRTALTELCKLSGHYESFREMLETHGRAALRRLTSIKNEQTKGVEWKRLLEDFDAKDPSEGDITPDVWSAIRWYCGGSFKIPIGSAVPANWDVPPDLERQPLVLSASYNHVMRVLSDWKLFSTEEQLRRIEPAGIPIFVAQQPGDEYQAQHLSGRFNYREEAEKTNEILMNYSEKSGFEAGYEAGKRILGMAKDAAAQAGRPSFKLELRRQYLLPALGQLCRIWYGLPDGDTFHFGAWTWQPPAARTPSGPRCPGDFLSPSRHTFYPRPTETVKAFADAHGAAVHEGSKAFVRKRRVEPFPEGEGIVARRMFDAIPKDDVLARNLVGTMIGAIPPMDGNLRGILLEWFNERTLWRLQAALRRTLGDRPALDDFEKAREVLYEPVSQAMCKRPAPDLIYRTALGDTELKAGDGYTKPNYGPEHDVPIKERDLVVVSLVSAAQWSLTYRRDGDVSIVFGGKRRKPYQSETDDIAYPVHACPAKDMAMGAIMGILAALLDAGRIQVLPASLIVKISDWPRPQPPPAA